MLQYDRPSAGRKVVDKTGPAPYPGYLVVGHTLLHHALAGRLGPLRSRFVVLRSASSLVHDFERRRRFLEGFLTTCSFDYMTDDSSTRLFVITIFIFAFVIPFGTVIFFYSKIVGLVRNHEAALKVLAALCQ